jgi:hypothetical protein
MVIRQLTKALAGVILLCPSCFTCAQEIVIRQVELNNGNVILHYDLTDDNPEHNYTLRLYSSKDNFIQPLTKVTGDIGVNVPVGGNKQVTWNAREELDSGFNGNITMELKGQVYIPFITISHFEDYGTFKRGKPYDLTWSGGRGDNVLNFDLYRGNEKIWTQPNVANSGNLTLVIPTNVKPGKKYLFRISDAHNPDEVVYTIEFSVKRKVPLGVKLGAGLVVAAGAAAIYSQLQPKSENEIPDPVMPTH